ncbi:HEAT repeat domain-containing protein [Thauera butanivorans]|uniref:HEAT repeat domain-containing protein n=1 Tax=Thauera butanivorans TaxID=86174 RepID=UPI000838499A|nr:HEAT repeat domain-containing protein [Thauera butanivorans]
MNATAPRKGATRAADIPADVLDALSRGELQSATLAEGLALDQARLLRTVFPQLSQQVLRRTDTACQLGILKRMAGVGAALLEELGNDGIAQCQGHASDTVRGWACFMIGAQPGLALPSRLAAIRPLADDTHFGVREWAWMAVRPHLAEELDDAIAHLTKWTTEPSERLRRFASEALRPRGVWCAHIAALKRQPERALPILSPLRGDLSIYVQDSVANWLNDAGKDRPGWVRELCAQWLQGHPTAATHRICQRALRNLK